MGHRAITLREQREPEVGDARVEQDWVVEENCARAVELERTLSDALTRADFSKDLSDREVLKP